MTELEIKQLALEICDGKIFGSWMIPDDEIDHILPSVFMPLVFGAAENLKENNAVSLYEYMDKAGPRSVNGYPCFMSCRFLTAEDLKLLGPMLDKIKAMREEFLHGSESVGKELLPDSSNSQDV